MAGIDVPVRPDSHEGAVTEPVARFLEPMVVDIRPVAGSANYYFYQHDTGQVIFCITPEPQPLGHATSAKPAPSCPWSPAAWSSSCPGSRTSASGGPGAASIP